MAARIKPAGKTQRERDAKALGMIESYMDGLISGELSCVSCREQFSIKEITPGGVALIRARYDKLRPSLSAVEQTLADPNASKTEEQMVEELVQAFTSLARKRPEVLRRAGLAFKPVAVAQHGAAHTLDENDSALAS